MDSGLVEHDARLSQAPAAAASVFAMARFCVHQFAMGVRRAGMFSTLLSALRVWRVGTAVFDPYRPELYYMRGPGPKWREKHVVPSGSNQAGAGSGI